MAEASDGEYRLHNPTSSVDMQVSTCNYISHSLCYSLLRLRVLSNNGQKALRFWRFCGATGHKDCFLSEDIRCVCHDRRKCPPCILVMSNSKTTDISTSAYLSSAKLRFQQSLSRRPKVASHHFMRHCLRLRSSSQVVQSFLLHTHPVSIHSSQADTLQLGDGSMQIVDVIS